jgi:alkylation response protein AidB-like acyl-CoA dehydrogenase
MVDTTAVMTTADVRRSVDAALDLIAGRADEIERERRIADDVLAALRASGMNRMAMPAGLGGMEAPVAEVVDLVERIAAVDASTAWCAVIAGGSNLFAGYIGEDAAREVFRDPDQGNATMFAPNGSVAASRLTGRWPFASNVVHSAWIGVGAFVQRSADGERDPVPRVCFVPVPDMTIEDTWDAMGLRGTGSHHVRAEDVRVDLARSCTFADRPWPEGTLWRVPIYCALLPTLAAVPLGIARGALDEVSRQAREGREARRGQVTDDPTALSALAAADARLEAARAGLRAVVAETHARAERGDRVDRQLQARTYLQCLLAADVGVEVTAAAHAMGGGAAAYSSSPLSRALRDVQTARQHLLFSPKHRIELGKIVAGVDVPYPPFVT